MPHGPDHIVVGIDRSRYAERALRWAVREAQLRRTAVTLVHAFDEHIATGSTVGPRVLAERLLADVADRHRLLLDQLPECDTVVTAAPDPGTALLEIGRHAQLVVLGTRGVGGFGELLLGSTSHHVLMHSAVPVALVPIPAHSDPIVAEEHDGRRPIVVGVDQSPEAQTALRWAFDEGCRRRVDVLVVHALDTPDPATLRRLGMPVELIAERLAAVRSAARSAIDEQIDAATAVTDDVRVDRVIDDDPPVTALRRHATAEHLLVVGTRGRRGFAELGPGSVSHQCAHHAPGPMIAAPHGG